jgi:uncharacterized protein (TIGR00162 family)
MDRTVIEYIEKPKLKNPIFIEGLPGIGNVGRAAAGYLVSELKAKKFAELYSPQFLPLVALQKNGVAKLLRAEFYYCKGKKNDIVILIGDSQSVTLQGYYELCGAIMDLVEKLGVKKVITLGGLGVEGMPQQPKIIGAVNDESLLPKYKKYGIIFDGSLVGTIIGASGLLLGFAKTKGIEALCLMAETPGFPLVITDPIAADSMLKMLMKVVDVKVDLTRLENEIKELEERIKKTEEIHKRMVGSLIHGEEKKDDTRYIG